MFGLAASLGVRVPIVEDEPYMTEALSDGLRLEAIAADVASGSDVPILMVAGVGCRIDTERGGGDRG